MNNLELKKFEALTTETLSGISGGNWRCVVGTTGAAIFGGAVGGPGLSLALGAAGHLYFCTETVS